MAAVIPFEGGVLTVRHEKDGRSYHLLPGGGVEAGETVGDALVREVREETGILCTPLQPLFINDSIAPDGSRHVIQITFLARADGGALTSPPQDPRVAGVEVVPIERLHELDLRPPIASELHSAALGGYAGGASYLGPVWSEAEGSTTPNGTA